MAKKRVYLHGPLEGMAPNGVEIEGSSAKEVIEGLTRQFKGFQRVVGQELVRICVLGFDTVEALVAPTDVTELHLVPSLSGAKDGGGFQIIVGAVLVVVGILTWNYQISIYGAEIALGSTLASVGAAMVLGGVAQMLAPQPTLDVTNRSDPEASKILPTNQNTVKIGTRIPRGYGRCKVFGHFLSFNVQSTDVVTATLT